MTLELFVLILFTDVDTIFQLERLNFPCFDTILHSLFGALLIYLQHFFTDRRAKSPEKIEN